MDDLIVKIQCLCNGVVCHAENVEEVEQADGFAIGTLPKRNTKDATAFYVESLRSISNQYMCYEEHAKTFERALAEKHSNLVPGFFVVSDAPYQVPEHGILCGRVDNPEQVRRALDRNARLLFCTQPELATTVLDAVQATANHVPLFVEVESLPQAVSILNRAPVDGFVTATVPTREELQTLLETTVRRESGWKGTTTKCLVGVLSHQGDYKLHIDHLRNAVQNQQLHDELDIVEVRSVNEVGAVDGLLMPGGWSNLQSWMLDIDEIGEAIKKRVCIGMPLCAVCAGMILARTLDGKNCLGRAALGLIDMRIENNELDTPPDKPLQVARIDQSTGRQLVERHHFSNGPYAADFSEAVIEKLAWIAEGEFEGKAVGVRQKNVSAFAFHEGFHSDFIGECLDWKRGQPKTCGS